MAATSRKTDDPPLMQRLLWFVGLWATGVGVVALVGWIIKLMIGGS